MAIPRPSTPGFFAVFLTPFQAVPFLLARPRMLLLAIMPVILNLLLFVGLSTLGYQFVARLLENLLQPGDGGWGMLVEGLARLFAILLVLGISAFVALILIVPVSAPFCDLISERIEREMLAKHPGLLASEMPLWQGIRHAIKEALRRVLVVVPFVVVLFLVGMIPLVGPLAASAIGLLYAATFLSMDAFSYSLDRRGMSLPEKWNFLQTHRRLWIPLGAGLGIFMLLPCNLVVVPLLSAVAGTRLYCAELLRTDRTKP